MTAQSLTQSPRQSSQVTLTQSTEEGVTNTLLNAKDKSVRNRKPQTATIYKIIKVRLCL